MASPTRRVWKTTSQQLLDNLGLDFQPRFNYNIITRWGEGLKENENEKIYDANPHGCMVLGFG